MSIRRQFLRYAVVGFGSNLVLYLLYLAMTRLGVGPKTAMTGLYVLGVVQTFAFNRRWSFGHRGRIAAALFRYWVAYLSCYFLNLVVLYLATDRMGFPHEPVQGAMILILAVVLFLLQRYWVFRIPRPSGA